VIVSCTCALGQHTAKRGVVGRGHGWTAGDGGTPLICKMRLAFDIHLTANLPRNLPVKNFFDRLRFDKNYGHESANPFFGPPCRFVVN